MKSLAEKMKKSALNFETALNDETKPQVRINAQTAVAKEKALKTSTIDHKIDLNEVERLKKALELKENELRNLQKNSVLSSIRFEDFKPRTFRITEEQYNTLRDLAMAVPKSKRKFDRITINTFLRAVLQNFIERKDQISVEDLIGEQDTYKEISKIFKTY